MLRRWISLWFVLALTLASANLFAPASVSAEPAITASCYGSSCNGLDPYTTGCANGAYAVASYYGLERKYSPGCNTYYGYANWGWQGASTEIWMLDDTSGSTHRAAWSYSLYSGMWASGQTCVVNYDRGYWCI